MKQVSRDLHKELIETREEVMAAMGVRLLARDFGAALILGTVWLHVIEARIRRTNNLEEGRCLIHEFDRGRNAIQKALVRLRESGRREDRFAHEKRRAVLP